MSTFETDMKGYQSQFLNLLGQQPDGSQAKILYNLFKLQVMAQNPNYTGKIDVNKVGADIQAEINNNQAYFAAFTKTILDGYTQSAFGMTPDAVAAQLSTYTSSPEFAKYMLSLPQADREGEMNKYLGTLGAIDSTQAQTAMTTMMNNMMQMPPADMFDAIGQTNTSEATAQVITLVLDQARLGSGVVNNLSKAISLLSTQQIAQMGSALGSALAPYLAQMLRQPGQAAQFTPEITAALASQLPSTLLGTANQVFQSLVSNGKIGAIGGAASLVGLVTGFTGTSDQGKGAFFWVTQAANGFFAASKANDFYQLGLAGVATLKPVLDALRSYTPAQLHAAALAATGAAGGGDVTGAFAASLTGGNQAAEIELTNVLGQMDPTDAQTFITNLNDSGVDSAVISEATGPEDDAFYDAASDFSEGEFHDSFQTPEELEQWVEANEGLNATQASEIVAEAEEVAIANEGAATGGAAATAAAEGEAAALAESTVFKSMMAGSKFLGPLGTALYGVGAADEAYNEFKEGNYRQGIPTALAATSVGILAAANLAGLFFTATAWIPVVGWVAGASAITFSIIAALLGKPQDPNYQLAHDGVGNGTNYWIGSQP